MFEKQIKELNKLLDEGQSLLYAMAEETNKLPQKIKDELKKEKKKLPDFSSEYDTWYTESLKVIEQIIPDRFDDFILQYKNEKRKEVSFLTYCVSDYLLGLKITSGYDTIVDSSAAIQKMRNQVTILKAAKKRFKSSLFDIKEVLQADLFDSELETSTELGKKGFIRGAGAIAGVVLEKHLGHVCSQHNIKTRKKYPSISDFNQLLKDNEIIEISQWRFIQHLGDIRNLCDHNKDREPTNDDLSDLINGVKKIIKTVF